MSLSLKNSNTYKNGKQAGSDEQKGKLQPDKKVKRAAMLDDLKQEDFPKVKSTSFVLQKFLARAGVASRRSSEGLITAGRVTVNGCVVAELGSRVDPFVDEVAVDGKRVVYANKLTTLMLHKPCGYITTMDDPHGRPCVASLVPVKEYPGLFPVGRLDTDTSGLLLFSTDGELGNRLMHPRHHVTKTYEVKTKGRVDARALHLLKEGIILEDGPTLPADVVVQEVTSRSSHLLISIREGRKRQVRRMFEAVGFPVQTLHRTTIGALCLGDLPKGEWRILRDEELLLLSNDVK